MNLFTMNFTKGKPSQNTAKSTSDKKSPFVKEFGKVTSRSGACYLFPMGKKPTSAY